MMKGFRAYVNKKGEMFFCNVWNACDLEPYLPMWKEVKYNVSVSPERGMLGAHVTLTPNREGFGTGWDTFEKDIRRCNLESFGISLEDEYGY